MNYYVDIDNWIGFTQINLIPNHSNLNKRHSFPLAFVKKTIYHETLEELYGTKCNPV